MKNQYVGDIGDYGKYALLQAFVNADVNVGVNWYLTDNDESNDGKFINYLSEERMRRYNPEIFDELRRLQIGKTNPLRISKQVEYSPGLYSMILKLK